MHVGFFRGGVGLFDFGVVEVFGGVFGRVLCFGLGFFCLFGLVWISWGFHYFQVFYLFP